MIDILAVILIIVFGLIVIFLVLSLIFTGLYAFSNFCFFELSSKICLAAALILFAVAMLLFVVIGVESFATFLEGV